MIFYICYALFVSLLFVKVEGVDRTVSVTRLFTRTGGAALGKQNVNDCACVDSNCGCCGHLVVEKVGLDDTVCVNVTYFPDQTGMFVTVSLNGVAYLNQTISVKHPPSYCYPVPYMEELSHLCLQMYDLDLANHTLAGCVRIQVQLEGLILGNFKLGCFSIPTLEVKRHKTLTFKKKTKMDFGVVKAKSNFNGCGCIKYNCGCCAHLEMERVGLNDTVCANVSYLPDQIGVSVTVSLDGVVYFNKTLSVKNPPPYCFGVPYLKMFASLCIQLYDLDVKNKTLTGCARILVKLEGHVLEKFNLGCFKIPPSGVKPGMILKFKKNVIMEFENMNSNEFAKLIDYFEN